ncbi:Serine/threonine-protein kinase tor1 [Diplonema papillatum]|nr:Serine/threonine-protein kinase tor1 [Diplonema papillatum]
MRRAVSGNDLHSAWGSRMKSGSSKGQLSPSLSRTMSATQDVDSAVAKLLGAEEGSEWFATLVTRQTATLAGDQLKQALRISGKKLYEIGRSPVESHRRACVNAVAAILRSDAIAQIAELSAAQEYVLLLHKAVDYCLKQAITHDDVLRAADVMGDLLKRGARGAIGGDITIDLTKAMAYQGSEWLAQGKPYRVHAGAALVLQFATNAPQYILPHLGLLTQAIPRALSGDAKTQETGAAAIAALASCGDAQTAASLLRLTVSYSSHTNPSLSKGAFLSVIKLLSCDLPRHTFIPVATSIMDTALSHFTTTMSEANRPYALRLIQAVAKADLIEESRIPLVFDQLMSILADATRGNKRTELAPAFQAITEVCKLQLIHEDVVVVNDVTSVWNTASAAIETNVNDCAEAAAECLASLAASYQGRVPSVDERLIAKICSLTLSRSLVDVLRRLGTAQPWIRESTTLQLLNRVKEVLSSPLSSSGTIIACLDSLPEADLQGIDQASFVDTVIAPLLENDSESVKISAAGVCCRLASKSEIKQCWEGTVTKILALGVRDPNATVRVQVWKCVEAVHEDIFDILASPRSAQAMCFSLCDTCEPVAFMSLTLATKVAHASPLVPLRLRAAILRQWNQILHSQDTLEQARAARAFGITHAALLRSSPTLMPMVFTSDEMIDVIAAKLTTSVPFVQAALFQVLAQLAQTEVTVSEGTLNEIEAIAVAAIRGDLGTACTKPGILALAAMVQHSAMEGVGVMQRHKGLLRRALDCLKGSTQEAQDVRIAMMKLVGVIGAITPLHAGSLLEDESSKADDLPWGVPLTDPDYYSFRVTRALLNILQEPRLRQHHAGALRAIQAPLKVLGTLRVIKLSKDIIPVLIAVAEASFAGDESVIVNLRLALQALNTLATLVVNNIEEARLPDLMKIAGKGIQCEDPAVIMSALQLIEVAARGLGPTFIPSMDELAAPLVAFLDCEKDESACFATLRIFETISSSALRPYVHLVAREMCANISNPSLSCAQKVRCIEVTSRVVIQNPGVRDVLPMLLHTLLTIVEHASQDCPYDSVDSPSSASLPYAMSSSGNPATSANIVDLWMIAVRSLGELSRALGGYGGIHETLFEPVKKTVAATAFALGIAGRTRDAAWESASMDEVQKLRLSANVNSNEPCRHTATQPRRSQTEAPRPVDHAAILKSLQGFGSPALWLDNFAQTILGESPRSILCTASSVARDFAPLAYELFGPSFVALCAEADRIKAFEMHSQQAADTAPLRKKFEEAENTRKQLVEVFNQLLGHTNLPGDIVQKLLCLAEFYERFEEAKAASAPKGAPIRANKASRYLLAPLSLCKLAERCGLHARALHWAEAEVLRHLGDDVTACRSLVKACKNLGIHGAEEGVLAILRERGVVDEQDTRLQEDLGSFQTALNGYKLSNDIHGMARCLSKLGAWHELLSLANATTEVSTHDPVMVMHVARASWLLGHWDTLEHAGCKILASADAAGEGAGFAGIGHFYLAVVSTSRGEFKKAQQFIHQSRRAIDKELEAYLSEGYTRSYDTLVSLQQLVELEEIVDYKQTIEKFPDKEKAMLEHLRSIWDSRLQRMLKDPSSLRGTLTQRSLLIKPEEHPQPWLDFAESCKERAGQRGQAKDVLVLLAGSLDPQTLLASNKPPQVVLAALQLLWDDHSTHELVGYVRHLAEITDVDEVRVASLLSAVAWRQKLYGENEEDTDWQELIEILRPATTMVQDQVSSTTQQKVWQEWAMLNHNAAFALSRAEYVVEGMNGFIKCANIGLSELAVPMVLRLLQLVFQFAGDAAVAQKARTDLQWVPAPLWLQVVPQLVARLGGNTAGGDIMAEILCHVATSCPHAVVYSLLPPVVSPPSLDVVANSRMEAAMKVMDAVRWQVPRLVEEAELMARELRQTAILESEKWRLALEEARSKHYRDPQRLLRPLFDSLKRYPSNVDQQQFIERFSVALLEADDYWTAAMQLGDHLSFQKAWSICHRVHRLLEGMKSEMVMRGLCLSRAAPTLAEAKNLQVAVPGCAAQLDPPLIHHFKMYLDVINTKTSPKKLGLFDDRGKQHDYLLKANEDLRLDERVMQILGLVQNLLQFEGGQAADDVVRFSVVPVGTNVGLLGWVANAEDLGRLVVKQRNYGMRYYEVSLILSACKMQKITDWQAQSIQNRISALELVNRETDGDDIHRSLWLGSASSERWIATRSAFSRSLAVMSMVGYVLGLGDRHMGNILLQRATGRVVHIDFGDCFDVARERKELAEQVPFRLTRQLRHATGVGGVRGVFRHTAISTMGALRRGTPLLMAVLEAFLHDPLLQWRLVLDNTEPTAPQQPMQEVPENVIDETDEAADMQRTQHISSALDDIIQNADDQTEGQDDNSECLPRSFKPHRSINHILGNSRIIPNPHPDVTCDKAKDVVRCILRKLTGTEFAAKTHEDLLLSPHSPAVATGTGIAAQVERLVEEATSSQNLAAAYSGWAPWL